MQIDKILSTCLNSETPKVPIENICKPIKPLLLIYFELKSKWKWTLKIVSYATRHPMFATLIRHWSSQCSKNLYSSIKWAQLHNPHVLRVYVWIWTQIQIIIIIILQQNKGRIEGRTRCKPWETKVEHLGVEPFISWLLE